MTINPLREDFWAVPNKLGRFLFAALLIAFWFVLLAP